MASERMPEPWYSFLSEVDRAATGQIAMHCIGGLAVSLYYGLARPTGMRSDRMSRGQSNDTT
jgi:hypothetical protein